MILIAVAVGMVVVAMVSLDENVGGATAPDGVVPKFVKIVSFYG